MASDTQPMVRNYIDGAFVAPEHPEALDVHNPSTGEVLARVGRSTADEVDRAVAAAARAFESWRQVPASRRVLPLFKLAALLRENEDRVARTLVAEMGKSLPDARAEIKRTVENVEAACGMPILQQGDLMVGSSVEIDGEVLRLPLGVFGIIAPFNFPAMVPFWFVPYAIAAGDTVVLKPSERVPMTQALIAEYIDQCELPPGVYNIVNGDRPVAEALIAHPEIQGISFVGSTKVGRLVQGACFEHGKRSQILGSAKNHLVAMPDAKLEHVIRNMVTSCFGCAGQRCMASSAIVAVGDETYDAVCEGFVEAAKKVIVADPLDPKVADEPMVMGAVISKDAKRFITGMIDKGVAEGAELLLDGRGVEVPGRPDGYYVGPTVFAGVKPGMAIHKTEIFGPVVVILKAGTFDEALEIVNGHQYGNGGSIYTQSGYWARRFRMEARVGMVGINVGIPAPVAQLPFGGTKASFLSDVKTQGVDGIEFFTERKVVVKRYWPE